MKVLDGYGSRMGLERGELRRYFNRYCPDNHDSIWLDMSDGTPAKIRQNCYNVIKQDI